MNRCYPILAAVLLALVSCLAAGPVPTLAPATQPAALTGAVLGTPGSWSNDGNTAAKAFDGSLTTWFDGPDATGDWVGLDFGSPATITGVAFAARPSWAGRMTGGIFQASTSADFTGGVTTIYTVAGVPAAEQLTTVTLAAPVTARYARYLGPAGGYCNVAEVRFLGSVAVATPAATVVTLPPPLPLTGIVCGGATAPAPTYTVTAGSIAWLDVTASTSVRDDRRLWSTGAGEPAVADPRHAADPTAYPAATLNPDTTRVGTVVTPLYDAAGTYPVTCVVTHAAGGGATYGVTVNVIPDARPVYYWAPTGSDGNAGTAAAPYASYAKLLSVIAHGNCRCMVAPGTYACPPPAGGVPPNVGSNVTIVGQRDAAGNRPVLMLGAGPAFYVYTTISDVLVRGLKFDSVGTPAKTGSGVPILQAPTSSTARAQPLQSSGSRVAMYDCDWACLEQGPQCYSGDLAVVRCVQGPATSMAGQVVLADGTPGRLVVAHCTLGGANAQANCRTDAGAGGWTGTIEANAIAQDAAAGDDAGVDLRAVNGFVVARNALVDCQLSTSSTDNNPTSVARNLLATGNVYRLTAATVNSSWVNVKSRATGVTITGEDFGPGITNPVAVDPGLVGVAVSGNNR